MPFLYRCPEDGAQQIQLTVHGARGYVRQPPIAVIRDVAAPDVPDRDFSQGVTADRSQPQFFPARASLARRDRPCILVENVSHGAAGGNTQRAGPNLRLNVRRPGLGSRLALERCGPVDALHSDLCTPPARAFSECGHSPPLA